MEAVKEGSNFENVSDDFKDDEEIVLKALKNGASISFVSEGLQNNRNIVLEAVKYNGGNYKRILKKFQKDRNFALEAIKSDVNILMMNDFIFKADEEIMLIALSQFGHVLEYADKTLQSNRNFIANAVKQGSKVNNHSILRYCDEKFLSDKEIMVDAIRSDLEAYELVHPNIKKSKEIVKAYKEHLKQFSPK